jgi:hypothetical protein
MKTFLALALVVTSFSSFAFERSATLDLTKIYGNINAGLYDVVVEFASKKTLSESSLKTETVYDDGNVSCKTSAAFDVGEMRLTLINKKDGYIKSYTKNIVANVTRISPSENCIANLNTFRGTQISYASLGINSINLQVKAPKNYKSIIAHLAPFSGLFELKTDIQVVDGKLVIDPSNLLSEESILELNSNHSNLSYNIQATSDAGSLSLANGLTPLE